MDKSVDMFCLISDDDVSAIKRGCEVEMIEYVIRIQVVEKARREGIAEIEEVREIPETIILSLDRDFTTLHIGDAVSEAQRIFKQINKTK